MAKDLATVMLGSIALAGQRMVEVAHIIWMKNVPPDIDTPTYQESLSITNQEGGSLAGNNFKINGQETNLLD